MGDIMNLRIYMKDNLNIRFFIKIENETKVLDQLNPSVVFHIKENEKTNIYIEQEFSKKSMTITSILLFLLTAVLQGIGNVLLLNTETKWTDHIVPYRICSFFSIFEYKSTELCLYYQKSKYSFVEKRWSLPKILLESLESIKTIYDPNYIDFKNQYFKFAKKIVSILTLLLVLLSFLLYQSIKYCLIAASVFVVLLILSSFIISLFILSKEFIKLKKLLKEFRNI